MKKKQIVTLLLIATLGITNNASVVGAIENTSEVTALEEDGEMNEANDSSNDHTESTDGNIVTTGDAVKEDVPEDMTEGDASEGSVSGGSASEGSIAEDTSKEENVEDDVTTEEPDNTTSEDTEEAEENKPGWSEDGLYYRDENGELAKGITKIDDTFYNFDKETGMLLKRAGWIEEDGKKYYSNEEGKLYVNLFIKVGDNRYYLGEDGSVQKGIVKAKDGNYYHTDENTGALVKKAGWIEKDDKKYFANEEGKLYRNQFISFGKTKYYLGDDGSVQKGIVKANDGNYYHMDEKTGVLVRKAGWIEKDDKKYFANEEGKLYRNQFISFGKTKYYMGNDGSIQKGIVKANDGNYYHMGEKTGVLVRKAGWIEKKGKRYFVNEEGRLYQNQFISFGKTYYYCMGDASIVQGKQYPVKGVLYTFDENGVMQIIPGWGEYNGRKYYINPSTGFPYIGWITFGKTAYYTDANGLLVSGWQKINGFSYYFYPSNYQMARDTTIDGKKIGSDGRVWDIAYTYASNKLDEIGWNLQAAFNWSASMKYVTSSVDSSRGSEAFAREGFQSGSGNCYTMAATFYCMAKVLGYDAHQVTGYVPLRGGGKGPHSWVEIDMNGTTYVFDPDFTHETHRNGYQISYGTSGTWRYMDYYRMN